VTAPALAFSGVRFERDGRAILDGIDWTVAPGERWVLLGPNGSGKTTMLRIASMYLHPTAGTADILGARLGRIDVRRHRERVGLVSAALADMLRPTIDARDVVVGARHGALEAWWHSYEDADRQRADELLAFVGCDHLGDRAFGTLSSGERQRVQLARTLMAEPELLLLDEPMAGLDLGGREDLVARLAGLAADPGTPPTVLVTHHVDEIPPGFTHALLLRDGRIVAKGVLADVVTSAALSDCFALPLAVERRDGRFRAWTGAG
jgi:iron complex transport system ATP-binding protein